VEGQCKIAPTGKWVRILLLHPDDSVHSGPWSGERWDLVIDLAWAGRCAYADISRKLGCPVRSIQELADPKAHASKLREVLAIGNGCFVDRYGIDWWEFANPYRFPILDQILFVSQLNADFPSHADIIATKPHLLVRILSQIRSQEIKAFLPDPHTGSMYALKRYARILRTFEPASLLQIAFDKWDTHYALRRWFARVGSSNGSSKVLQPSAYRNVTRTQAEFARLLPHKEFLSVVTRRDGRLAGLPPNVEVRSLAGYAPKSISSGTEQEIRQLQQTWTKSTFIKDSMELQLAEKLGAFKNFPQFLESGLRVRDAWWAVLEKERISAVLSADENNPFTRMPISLARQRNIPTVYVEHGALNFNLGFREPCSHRYLAHGEMLKDYWLRWCHLPEKKITLGANVPEQSPEPVKTQRDLIVFFSSEYESAAGRIQDFYREALPRLCALAQKYERKVVVKLHPFESMSARRQLIKETLSSAQLEYLDIRGGPLTNDLLDDTWVALTVESSAAVECAMAGIPVFLCNWFDASWWGYCEQFIRFSVAQALNSPDEIAGIPNRMPSREKMLAVRQMLATPMTSQQFEATLRL